MAKDATPQVQLVNGQADIAYTVRVRNNGPNQAHNVHVVDAAPSGVTFLVGHAAAGERQLLDQPAAPCCDCSLGTLGPGVERVIGVSARVTQTGTYVNCATAVGGGKDTNAREQQGVRLDARHRAGDAAGDAADAEADAQAEADAEAEAARRSSAASSR